MTAPYISLKEEDLSTFVQTYSASQAAFAGEFSWGPVDYPVLIANETALATRFGTPSLSNNATFYTVVGYLDYSDNQSIIRSAGVNAKNATDPKRQAILAQISNVEGEFQIGEIITTSDGKTAVVMEVTATEIYYYDESAQFVDNTTITGNTSGATATIESTQKSYSSLDYNTLRGELKAGDTITGGSSSAAAIIVEVTDYEIVYTLTTDNDFINGESVVSNTSASFNVSKINGILHYVISGTSIKNKDVFNNMLIKNFIFAARYMGTLGNSLLVSIANRDNFDTWEYKGLFDSAPDADEMHIVVVDLNGKFFNSYAGNVLETYGYVTMVAGSKDANNQPNYYRTLINENSAYIYAGDDDIDELYLDIVLEGGADDQPTESDIINSYKVFNSPRSNDVSYYYSGLYTPAVDNSIIAMAEDNMKTILFTSPSKIAVLSGDNQTKSDAIIEYAGQLTVSNKAFVDCNWRQVLDTYNNVLVWVPCCSATCGLSSRCDTNYNVWNSPMGYTRGLYVNTTRLGWEPEKQYRDAMYKVGVNPVFTDGADGVVLLGDRMHTLKPSYLRQIAVRKTIIVIEQSALGILKYYLGENNNAQTRALARGKLTSFLRDIGAQGAFRRAQVVLDETNNTEQVIDEQKMRCLIRVQPQSSINYIELTISVVNSVAQFTENIIPGTF